MKKDNKKNKKDIDPRHLVGAILTWGYCSGAGLCCTAGSYIQDKMLLSAVSAVLLLVSMGLGVNCVAMVNKLIIDQNKELNGKNKFIRKKCAEINALKKQLENQKLNNQQKVQ